MAATVHYLGSMVKAFKPCDYFGVLVVPFHYFMLLGPLAAVEDLV